ncbi:hypothetical protein LCGC14_2614200, partial [marine sediment metagenome]
LAGVALVAALGDSGDDSANQQQLTKIREELSDLRGEISTSTDAAQNSAKLVGEVSEGVKKLERQVSDLKDEQSDADGDIARIKRDLSDLSDRVDQVELAQEEAASGGP